MKIGKEMVNNKKEIRLIIFVCCLICFIIFLHILPLPLISIYYPVEVANDLADRVVKVENVDINSGLIYMENGDIITPINSLHKIDKSTVRAVANESNIIYEVFKVRPDGIKECNKIYSIIRRKSYNDITPGLFIRFRIIPFAVYKTIIPRYELISSTGIIIKDD